MKEIVTQELKMKVIFHWAKQIFNFNYKSKISGNSNPSKGNIFFFPDSLFSGSFCRRVIVYLTWHFLPYLKCDS